METQTQIGQKELKLQRLRDVVNYHIEQARLTKDADFDTQLAVIDACERDIKVYIKNFVMALGELDASAHINQVGDNTRKASLHTSGIGSMED